MAKDKPDTSKIEQLIRDNPDVSCRSLWASLNPVPEDEFRAIFNKVVNEKASHGNATS